MEIERIDDLQFVNISILSMIMIIRKLTINMKLITIILCV